MQRVVRELSFCENICKNDALCHDVAVVGAVAELGVSLGREVGQGKAWLGAVICSLPAASGVEASPGMMERAGRRKGVTPWGDGKAARPACSEGGDAVLCPRDVSSLVLPGGPCQWVASDVWRCLRRREVEGADFYVEECACFMIILHPWSQAAAFS